MRPIDLKSEFDKFRKKFDQKWEDYYHWKDFTRSNPPHEFGPLGELQDLDNKWEVLSQPFKDIQGLIENHIKENQ